MNEPAFGHVRDRDQLGARAPLLVDHISSGSRAARRPEIARLPYLRDMTPAMIALILALAVRLLARVVAGCRAV
jgi:hypothetical protein